MAYEAATLLQLVALITWTCLTDTPFNQKNTLFARFFTKQGDIEEAARTASIFFCPGLFEVLQASTPPTIQFLKSLPSESTSRWVIYVLVLEKPGCRTKIYVGSGTSALGGVRARLKQYDDGFLLPTYIEKSLNDGYTIVSKGLLCWIPIPSPTLQPVGRLLMFALEATFAYMFWAMRSVKRDWGMGHICLWNREALEYQGLCSHCSLNEAIIGDFDLTPEQLEAQAIEKEQKRLELKAENATNHHFKQMAENYDEYIGEAGRRVAKSRANHPGRDKVLQANRIEKATAAKTFHCALCNITCGTKQRLENHLKTPKHLRKHFEPSNPWKCAPCNLGFHNKSNLTRHQGSTRHQQAVAALSSPKLD